MHTSKALTAMGIRHNLIVEPQEVEKYLRSIEDMGLDANVVELDLGFKRDYELCDDLGLTKSTGPGPARNFAWHHSMENGFAWHWVMDDNIEWFFRFNNNLKTPCKSPAFFKAIEDFCQRYENVAMAGPNYFMFAARKVLAPAFVLNTRIYSCNLIRNEVPFRWRGRYNEDTILSLDLLKAGWCTVQFNAFLQDKMETQKLSGGNSDEFYLAEGSKDGSAKYAVGGTDAKSEMLVAVHPDVAALTHKFSRTHHEVDYSQFKQRLVYMPGIVPEPGANNYGMELRTVDHYRGGA
jgi:hypothetical protein